MWRETTDKVEMTEQLMLVFTFFCLLLLSIQFTLILYKMISYALENSKFWLLRLLLKVFMLFSIFTAYEHKVDFGLFFIGYRSQIFCELQVRHYAD